MCACVCVCVCECNVVCASEREREREGGGIKGGRRTPNMIVYLSPKNYPSHRRSAPTKHKLRIVHSYTNVTTRAKVVSVQRCEIQ